jgi:hypothetical protein
MQFTGWTLKLDVSGGARAVPETGRLPRVLRR